MLLLLVDFFVLFCFDFQKIDCFFFKYFFFKSSRMPQEEYAQTIKNTFL